MSSAIRILIVDDSPLTRAGAAALLSSQSDLVVAGQAENAADALRLYRELRPDVVLTDLRMPGIDGVELTRLLRSEAPDAHVLVLTHYVGDENVFQALRAGALGYVHKEIQGAELMRAVRAVAAGARFLPAGIAEELAQRVIAPSLSPRENEVLNKLALGLTNPQIAEELGLSRKTVSIYVSHVLAKLEVKTRTEAVSVGIRRGIVRQT